MTPSQVIVGRQPVYDADLMIAGYELLFRDQGADDAPLADRYGDEMTATVLSRALSIGLDRLVGDKSVYCNADRGVLTGAVPLLLPPDRTIVEIRETVHYDTEIDDGCRALRAAGYRIALANFTWFDGADELIRHASVVKLDVHRLGVDQALRLGERCRPFGVRLLAGKLDTAAELDVFLEHGFDLFQGYALARPITVRGAGLDASALAVLQVAAAVLDERTDIADVERIVRRDPALTVQLLEVASIGPMGYLRRSVTSIRDALVLLGTQRLRSWVTLLMLRSSRGVEPDGLLTVLVRARMCELLADRAEASSAFTTGMVSGLDRLLGMPAAELVDVLPLDRQLLDAAFGGAGEVGQLVRRVIDWESGAGTDGEQESVAPQALEWAVQSAELLERA